MTRVIHTGDTHVGYRQYHSPERRADFLRAFERVVEDAVADDVDAVVHAGDLFHDRRPGLVDLQGVIDVLRKLDRADVPFLAVVGNHETKRDAQWLDLFEDLGLATRLGADPVEVGDTAFYGLDFVPRSRRSELTYEFAGSDAEDAALVSHGLFEPFAHADWDTERLLAESTVDFDVVLLGDNHEPGRERVDGTLVTYCGSTERTSASERDERGYNIVTFDGDVQVTRRGLPTREFVFVDLELADGEGQARVREAVRQHDLESAVVIVTLTGEGDPVSPAAVEEFADERGALVARVNDRRELETGGEDRDVSFADPDDAVRERIAGMGLSEAARDVDEVVRSSKVADSNVRKEVERRVRERLDAEDLSAFETADPEPEAGPDSADDPGSSSDPEDGSRDEREGDDGQSPDDDVAIGAPQGSEDPADGTATADPTGEGADTVVNRDDGTDPVESSDDDVDIGESGDGDADAAEDGTADDDQQVSMEEYL